MYFFFFVGLSVQMRLYCFFLMIHYFILLVLFVSIDNVFTLQNEFHLTECQMEILSMSIPSYVEKEIDLVLRGEQASFRKDSEFQGSTVYGELHCAEVYQI